MKKYILVPVILLFCSGLILIALIRWSDKPNAHKNGFNRKMLFSHPLLLNQVSTKEPLYKIAGFTQHHIYFSKTVPNNLKIYNYNLKGIDSVKIPLPINQNILRAFDFVVDSPIISIYAPNLGAVINYNTDKKQLSEVKLATPLFTRYIPISSQTLFLRGFDSVRQHQLFMKTNAKTGQIIKQKFFFNNQQDAGFSTDGTLLYDDSLSVLLYVQTFQNKFLCMDTNLNLIYSGKTIDTSSSSTVSVERKINKNKNGSIMPAAPPRPVNRGTCVSNGNLFILSSLQADNEKDSLFANNDVIDLYNIFNGNYKGSFYIPNLQGEKIRHFKIKDDFIIVLYDDLIATYKWKLPNKTNTR